MRYALQTAHEATGLQRTALHATEAGYPICSPRLPPNDEAVSLHAATLSTIQHSALYLALIVTLHDEGKFPGL